MEYRFLGKTGVKLSVLGLGCANFGERTSEEEAEKIILRALEAGINFIDTANVYPNQGLEGKSEKIIGNILKKHGLRDKFFLATKVRARMSNNPKDSGLSKDHILNQINKSLERFQTKNIDLYQFHRPDNSISITEQLSTISQLVQNNKIRYFGLSSFLPWQLVEFLWISEKKNYPKYISLQSKYNLLDRSIEADTSQVCNKYKIGLFAYSPLDGGVLSGKYRLNNPAPPNSRHTIWKMDFKKPENKEKLEKIEELSKIAKAKNISLVQLSIAWILQNKNIICCIIGPRTLEQFNEYLLALKVSFSTEELAIINKICPPPYVWKASSNSMFR